MSFRRKDLLGLEGLSEKEITGLLDRADALWDAAGSPGGGAMRPPPVAGLTAVNLFLEPSTRTRCSFELAEARLGIERITIEGVRLSLEKGETLADTGRVLAAMGVNVVVLRHPEGGAPAGLAAILPGAHVVNAGDGTHEHPTQALLDLLVLRRRWGSLAGRRILIVGDIRHSRVARSNLHGLTALGAEVTLCGPASLLPDAPPVPRARVTDDLDGALAEADAVLALRIQRERFGTHEDLPDGQAYRRRYGLTAERVARLPEDVPLLHPGPVNRGVEMDDAVIDGRRSLIFAQVTAGVAVRMAVLDSFGR